MIVITGQICSSMLDIIILKRESISQQKLFDSKLKYSCGWLLAAAVAAVGKLWKRINNRNNDDDRRKKLNTWWCSVWITCVLAILYIIRLLFSVIALRFILSPFSSTLWVLWLAVHSMCDTHFSLLHTQKYMHTYTQRRTHTWVNTTISSTTTKRTYQVSKHIHTHAPKRYHTNNNNNNCNSTSSNMVDAIECAHAIFPLALTTQCVGSHSIERFDSVRKFRLRQNATKLRPINRPNQPNE